MSRASELLRAARVEEGLTQAQLAARAGTTQSVVARMESPGSNPTVASLDDLLAVMNRRIDMTAATALPEADDVRIAAQRRLSPAERLASHDASQRNLRPRSVGSGLRI